MATLLWDSSALGKRYVEERGAETVEALFSLGSPMVSAYLVYVEVANIIRRHRNNGVIDNADFQEARRLLESDLLSNAEMTLLSVHDAVLLASIPLADTHNLNATDAALLYVFREYARETGERCLFLAADLRLLRAATAEGLPSLNPETVSPEDLATYAI